MSKQDLSNKMRVYHRYLGFFLAGIMAMYSISGIVLIFRDTDFLKQKKITERTLPANIKTEAIGEELGIRDFKIEKEENGIVYFKGGTFDKKTSTVELTSKKLPFVLDKMTNLHKAKSKEPLFFLNIFFGLSLLFFVISSFWMFLPKTRIFKKGLYFTLAGLILTIILLFI